MNFGEIVDDVIVQTGRPNARDKIRSTVNRTVERVASSGYFPMALVEITEESVQFNSLVYNWALPVRFRAISYIKPSADSVTYYEHINVDQRLRRDCYGYYVSGTVTRIKAKTLPANEIQDLAIGYYEKPARLVENADSNWITERLSYLLISIATAEQLAILGDSRSSAELDKWTLPYLQHEINMALHLTAG